MSPGAAPRVPALVDAQFWRGRRVMLTGHTGFKGAWLALWLQSLGASVTGFSGGRPTQPSLYELARVGEDMVAELAGDIRDQDGVADAIEVAEPEVVIHLAAQSLVRRSFAEPAGTFAANVMGTVNVLEAVRRSGGVRVLLSVTSDKCYENHADCGAVEGGSWRGFDEASPLGGEDPYSASKGAAELAVGAYRSSFFADPEGTRVASVRAGNVIGGGDWGADRLVADFMRAALSGESVSVRNPAAIRPWQHVINPLGGYLLLAQALWREPELAGPWNFGPPEEDARTVGWVAGRLAELWPGGIRWDSDSGPHPPEARYLKIDSGKAREQLGWLPSFGLEAGLEATVDWYRELRDGADMRSVTLGQIEALRDVASPA